MHTTPPRQLMARFSYPAVTFTPGTDLLHSGMEHMFSQEFSLYAGAQCPFYFSALVLSFQKCAWCRHLQLGLKQFGFTQAVFVLSFVSSRKVSSGLVKCIQYIKRWQLFKSSSFQITFLQHRINSLAVSDIRSRFGDFAVIVF